MRKKNGYASLEMIPLDVPLIMQAKYINRKLQAKCKSPIRKKKCTANYHHHHRRRHHEAEKIHPMPDNFISKLPIIGHEADCVPEMER